MKRIQTNILLIATSLLENEKRCIQTKEVLPSSNYRTYYSLSNSTVLDITDSRCVCLPLYDDPFETVRGFSINNVMYFVNQCGELLNFKDEKISKMGWEYAGMTLYFKKEKNKLDLISIRRNETEEPISPEDLEIEKDELIKWEV